MGYRLSIEAISTEYYDESKEREFHNIKELYYGTKLYGYGLDLEESLSYNFLKQEEIQNIFNNIKLKYKNFLIYWF